MWVENATVIAELKTPVQIEADISQSVLHPSFLDGCFQLLVDLLKDDMDVNAGIAFVPTQVNGLLLYKHASVVSFTRGQLVKRSPRSVVMNFELFDQQGEVVAFLQGARFRAVQLKRSFKDHTSYLAEKLIPMPLAKNCASVIQPVSPADPDTGAGIEKQAVRPAQNALQLYHREVAPLLDILSAAFAERALRELTQGQSFDEEELVSEGLVSHKQALLLHHLIDILQEDGFLEPVDHGMRWVSDSDMPEPEAIWNSLLGDYPDFAAECLLIGRIGTYLSDLLRGRVAIQSLLPKTCDGAGYSHYMGDSLVFETQNRNIAENISVVLEQLDKNDRLRILELSGCGAHLGVHVLPRIDFDRCDYVLCVPTEEALMQYDGLLERYPAVKTVVLDISRASRTEMEFFESYFDLAIINHELAVSANPDLLLENIRDLMLPQGLLLVSESFSDRWTDMVFGLDEDWWLKSTNGHWQSRLRSPQFWQNLLLKQGYSIEALQQQDELHTGVYLLTAQANKPVAQSPVQKHQQENWLILQDQNGYSSALAASITAELDSKNCQVIPVITSDSLEKERAGRYVVDFASVRQVKSLFSGFEKQGIRIDGILHLADLPQAESPSLVQQVNRCQAVINLVNVCASLALKPEILLVSRDAETGLLAESIALTGYHGKIDPADAVTWGLGRTLINEFPDMDIRLVDLADIDKLNLVATALAHEVLSGDKEDEVVLTGDGRFTTRIRKVEAISSNLSINQKDESQFARLEFSMPGPLKHLGWYAHPVLDKPAAGEVEIEVRAAGLNFRDVMYAMGLLSDEAVENGFAGPTLGMELSGVITRLGNDVEEFNVGDEVIAFAPSSFATRAITSANAVVHKPAEWSFEAAATVPTTFFTVYYALHQLAQLQPGERILIHGAAGGVGIAAIQYARSLGAEIFATAGSDEKRDFVRLLGADHVFDSRSLAFADEILHVTDNEGVDVVLNSLAGEAINRNLKVLKPFGRFLELGKRDFYENTRIGLRPFRNNISYFGIDADQLMSVYPDMTRRLFRELMELFNAGELKPLPYRAFSSAEVVDAFRYMQQSKQIGKIVVTFNDPVKCLPGHSRQNSSLALSVDATYLVTGGLGGFGLKTALWLAEKGARHLLLIGRRGSASDESKNAIKKLEMLGVNVNAAKCDVSDRESLTALFNDVAKTMPPVRGVVHAAMVISDGLVRNMPPQQLHKVFAPKIQGARLLDELTRGLELDFFVMYSSITTLFGNPGQANYVAANRYLEAMAHARRQQGLPGLAVCWGAIDDVGYLARNEEIKQSLQARMGGAAIDSVHALEILEQLILNDRNGIGIIDLDWHAISRFLASAGSPKFIELARQAGEKDESEAAEDIQRLLEELSHDELTDLFVEMMKKEVSEILRIPVEKLDANESVYEMGMDSLMAMELAAAIDERFGISLPLMSLSEGPTIARLVERVIEQLDKPQVDKATSETDLDVQIQQVVAQHGAASAELVDDIKDAMEASEQNEKNSSLLH